LRGGCGELSGQCARAEAVGLRSQPCARTRQSKEGPRRGKGRNREVREVREIREVREVREVREGRDAREVREVVAPDDRQDVRSRHGHDILGSQMQNGDRLLAREGPPLDRTPIERLVMSNNGSDDTPEESPEARSHYTTVMLRNIPNKYTREMLIKQLSVEFHGQFDFMYLPIDFKNKCNVGYGFINFRTHAACECFIHKFHGVDVRKCLPGLNSKKVVEVTPARVQGLAENIRRLRNSPVMNQLQDHPEWMPLIFNSNGDEEKFPMPECPLPPVKPRGRNREAMRSLNE